MSENHYSQELTHVLQKNLYDKEVELFWYNYKNYVLNIYRNNFYSTKDDFIIRNLIEEFSSICNELQKKYEYKTIIQRIRNFQLFIVFFILSSFRNRKIEFSILNTTFILHIKFIKRWNQISILEEPFDKIPIKNWSKLEKMYLEPPSNFLNLGVKAGITLAIICKNLPIRKYGQFCNVLDTVYVFNHYQTLNKMNYSLDMEILMPELISFLKKCIPILLFDLETRLVDASIGPLDYISVIYDFKDKWLEKQKQLKSLEQPNPKLNHNPNPNPNLNPKPNPNPNKYKNISTRKFCCKLRNYLNLEDFIE